MFNKPIKTSVPPISYNHDALTFPNKLFSPFPSVFELHKGTNKYPSQPLIETEVLSLSSSPSPSILHNSLAKSDCLFFIQYTPENTLKIRWFLVQIDHVETVLLKIGSKIAGNYYLTFLSHHPNDNDRYNDAAR